MSDTSNEPKGKARSQGALAVAGLVMIAALVAIGIYTWRSVGDVSMDTNGYVALVLGVLGTVGLGGGLMALLFISHRSGYDDEVGGSRPRGRR